MLSIPVTPTPQDLAAALLRHTQLLLRMGACHLNIEWVTEFSSDQLDACCERIAAALDGVPIPEQTIQRELIQNPCFADYYAALIRQFPEEPAAEPEPAPARSGASPYRPSQSASQPESRRKILTERLCGLLEVCWENSQGITAFPVPLLMETLELDALCSCDRLTYLCNFAPLRLSKEDQETIGDHLSRCVDVPLALSDVQKELLFEPLIGSCRLFATADFQEVCELLESYPDLLGIARLLFNKDISNDLQLKQYRAFAEAPSEYLRLMEMIFTRIEPEAAESFLRFWQKSGCPLRELQVMAQRIAQAADLDLGAVFSNYPGYINLLYGRRFKQIDLSQVNSYQEDILIYAIVHQKKHFMRLVDGNAPAFLSLPANSLLFVRELYEEHFNLNELTEKDLEACAWMSAHRLHVAALSPARVYTFPELQTLYNAPDTYVILYGLLTWDRQDDRLKVIKQLLKRDVLGKDLEKQELVVLAGYLSQKPLYQWMREDFGHISGLQAADTVQLLLRFDQLSCLLPSIRNRTDALLALRCGKQDGKYATMEELKKDIVQADTDWAELSEAMGLSETFCAQYQEGILEFLCHNGGSIANVYRRCLGASQEKAFLRVVKAELMGQLRKLKYYEDDLQRELDFPLTEHAKASWQENTNLGRGGVTAQEYDDFFSTMLLGVTPRRTCLSYENGAYRHCLLAGFDSNKKVLYATYGGSVVGRAYLRLTKGRPARTEQTGGTSDRFTFVDLEDIGASRPENTQSDERLTLFLERPYFSGIDDKIQQQVKAVFTELVTQKAQDIGATLVLSCDYQGARTEGFAWTRFDIYISKTKAGAQYLDSLDGQATVSAEGSYQPNSFLVLNTYAEKIY